MEVSAYWLGHQAWIGGCIRQVFWMKTARAVSVSYLAGFGGVAIALAATMAAPTAVAEDRCVNNGTTVIVGRYSCDASNNYYYGTCASGAGGAGVGVNGSSGDGRASAGTDCSSGGSMAMAQ